MDKEELKILVAVPAVDIRAVAQALTEAGFRYSLHTANTAEAASDGLGQIGFDFAILGETLPDDGGEALLPHIIGHGIEVPVIFIFDGDMDLSRATNVVRLGVADCFHQSELSSERLERAALTALRFYRAQSKAIRAQKQLTMRALFDPLTDLPNRGLFFARVNRALALSEKDNREVAILAIDLNRFRDVNNVLSHAAGDELLRLVTTRLNNVVRTTDTLARLGADEFAILMPKNASIPAAESMARRVHDAMLPPYTIERQNLGVGSSIGIAPSRIGQFGVVAPCRSGPPRGQTGQTSVRRICWRRYESDTPLDVARQRSPQRRSRETTGSLLPAEDQHRGRNRLRR